VSGFTPIGPPVIHNIYCEAQPGMKIICKICGAPLRRFEVK
jgi:hypothetical protein